MIQGIKKMRDSYRPAQGLPPVGEIRNLLKRLNGIKLGECPKVKYSNVYLGSLKRQHISGRWINGDPVYVIGIYLKIEGARPPNDQMKEFCRRNGIVGFLGKLQDAFPGYGIKVISDQFQMLETYNPRYLISGKRYDAVFALRSKTKEGV